MNTAIKIIVTTLTFIALLGIVHSPAPPGECNPLTKPCINDVSSYCINSTQIQKINSLGEKTQIENCSNGAACKEYKYDMAKPNINAMCNNESYERQDHQECFFNNPYWVDSAGNRQDIVAWCQPDQTCQPTVITKKDGTTKLIARCQKPNNCTTHYETRCIDNGTYYFDSCGNNEGLKKQCTGQETCDATFGDSCRPKCTPRVDQKCIGNEVYYYDSCGNKGELAFVCGNNYICNNGACDKVCKKNAFKACAGKSLYYYDSCSNRGELIETCDDNEKCTNKTKSCVPKTTHSTCVNNACKIVAGEGQDTCTKNSDCIKKKSSKTKKEETARVQRIDMDSFASTEKTIIDIDSGKLSESYFSKSGRPSLMSTTCNTLPSGKIICDFQPYRIEFSQEVNNDFKLAECIPYSIRQVKLPHIHVEMFEQPFNELFFRAQIGVYSHNNEKCTFFYEDVATSTRPICQKYCGKDYKTPKEIISDKTRYPIEIPEEAMDKFLATNHINGDWAVETPIISVDNGVTLASLVIQGTAFVGTVVSGIILIFGGIAGVGA